MSHDRLDIWGTKDGLPPQDITSIAQTPDGYIWLGTASGLLRFDGDRFRLYNTQSTPSLTSNLISTLAIAPDGTLWVGTEWGGFGTFKNGVFHRVSEPDPKWSVVNGFLFNRDGSVWVYAHGSCSLFRVVNGHVRNVTLSLSNSYNVTSVIRDSSGELLWATQGSGIGYLRNDVTPLPYELSKRLPSVYISCLTRDNHGDLWVGTNNDGLCRIRGESVTRYSDRDGLPSNSIACLYQDLSGNLWIGTSNGLGRWDGRRFTRFTKADGLTASSVHSIMQDREGNLWVAAGGGLNRFGVTKLVPMNIVRGTEQLHVTSISPRLAGGIWLGTNRGLWTMTSPSEPPALDARLGEQEISGVVEGAGGVLWRWLPLKNGRSPVVRWQNGTSSTVYVDGEIHWAVADGSKLVVFCDANMYRTDGKSLEGPWWIDSGNYVFDGAIDPDGTIWLGTNNGLIAVRGTKASVVDTGLPAGTHVLSVSRSSDGSLWLGTERGLVHYAHGKGVVYGTADGLPDANVFEVMRSDDGTVWCGCHAGLFSIRERDLENRSSGPVAAHLYGPADGVVSTPLQYSYVKSDNGALWFAGFAGVTYVNPGQMPVNNLPPPVSITRASVDGHSLSTTGMSRIAPGPGRLEIQYAGLSFVAPERVRFRYRLFGLDNRWIDAGDRRIAAYTNLAPGKYEFQVIACNNDGVWNKAGATVSFELAPHFYQTAWFKTLAVIGSILALALLFKFLTRQLADRAARLEALVQERTSDLMAANERLTEAHDELGAQNDLLQAAQAELETQNEELADMQAELESQNQELLDTQSELEKANERLRDLATTDGLTGLKNHRSFREQLGLEWARVSRAQQPLSVILMDVDEFKKYNDTFGHPAGDDVLRSVAGILRSTAREGDFVARYGGEEFVILLPNTDADAAVAVAERFRAEIERHAWTHRSVTASFGVSTTSTAIASANDLVSTADGALYKSKLGGRNRVSHHGDPVEQDAAA